MKGALVELPPGGRKGLAEEVDDFGVGEGKEEGEARERLASLGRFPMPVHVGVAEAVVPEHALIRGAGFEEEAGAGPDQGGMEGFGNGLAGRGRGFDAGLNG